MPDNATYYHVAYGAIVALFAAYALSLALRHRALARRRARQAGGRA